MSNLNTFDHFLQEDGPAALFLRQHLMPVEGEDGVVFPSTYAGIGYNIDGDINGENVCLIDSVGSQANRIEPIFMQEKYKNLVPQVVIQANNENVNLLEIAHRAGDALIRCSTLQQEKIQDAFISIKNDNNSELLARIAPTSLVFGVWDSRNTQVKLPRLISSTIRAFNVRKLTRSAVYTPPINYSDFDVFTDAEKSKAEDDNKNPLSKRGFVNALSNTSHGGIIAKGGIRRDATLSLSALRLLRAATPEETLALQRYILGISLVAFSFNPTGYLRQGANLVLNASDGDEFVVVHNSGTREQCSLTQESVHGYAQEVANAFGIEDSLENNFVVTLAKNDIKIAKKK